MGLVDDADYYYYHFIYFYPLQLLNDISLDARPEFVRASVISKEGVLCARVTGDQVSLQPPYTLFLTKV